MNTTEESATQLLARIIPRKPLEILEDKLFPHPVGPKDVIELFAAPAAGKTHVLISLIVQSILPNEYKSICFGGKSCHVVLVDTMHHFDILQLEKRLMNKVSRAAQDQGANFSDEDLGKIVKESLHRLIVIKCYDSSQLSMTFVRLKEILLRDANISAIMMDGLLAYYWQDRITSGFISMEAYRDKMLTLLLKFVGDFQVTIFYTRLPFPNEDEAMLPDFSILRCRAKLSVESVDGNGTLIAVCTSYPEMDHQSSFLICKNVI